MDITLAICTYNGEPRLGPTLDALVAQRVPAGVSWEVLLVDNASTDGTAQLAERYMAEHPRLPLRALHEPTPGKTHALRLALREAKGELFAIVDDDNILAPDWVAHAVRFMAEHPRAGTVGGRIDPRFEDPASKPDDFDRFKGLLAIRDEHGDADQLGVRPLGAGMVARTAVARYLQLELGTLLAGRVGGDLGSGEDHEVVKMFECMGWQSWYTPTLRMEHLLPARRLERGYIERLRIEAAACLPWLSVLEAPDERWTAAELRRGWRWARWYVVKHTLLSWLPASLCRATAEAPFRRRYYQYNAKGWAALVRDHEHVARILTELKHSPHRLDAVRANSPAPRPASTPPPRPLQALGGSEAAR